MKVGVLGLQGDVAEHLAVLERIGERGVVVRRADEIAGIDGLIIPGGESTTIGKLLDRFALLDPLIERARAGMPVFGTCAGMILMAREVIGPQPPPFLLGLMDMKVRRNAYGRQVESFEAEIRFGTEKILGAFIRAPIVEELGEGVEVLGTHEGRPVLVRQERLLASSFHPEVSGEVRVHETFLELISEN